MPPFETRSSQFGLISGIRQPASDMVLVAEPASLFAPEARKGRLYMVAEAEGDVARGRDACQLAIQTIRRVFYADSSYSVTSSLRKALGAANKALYDHNFSVAPPKRAVVGVTCAVLKDDDLYVAQILPAQAYLLSGGKLRALPPVLSWGGPQAGTTPLIKPNAIGASLSIEPEFYRAVIGPGDALMLCSSNLARLLGQDDVLRMLRSGVPEEIAETLASICKQSGMGEAHGLVAAAAPPLSPAAQAAPLSRAGIAERGRLALRAAGGWASRVTGEATLMLKGSQARAGRRRAVSRVAHERRQEELLNELPPEPAPPPSPPPAPPLDLGEPLEDRLARERQERRSRLGAAQRREVEPGGPPPSVFLGEGDYIPSPPPERRIDLSDTPGMAALGRSARRPGAQQAPPLDPTIRERLAQPFAAAAGAVSRIGHRRKLRRPPPSALPQARRGAGLTYRRQGPPFPWHMLLILVLVVAAAVLYGLNLSREVTERHSDDTLVRAAQAVAALRDADDNSAQVRLDAADAALAEVRASGAVTATLQNKQRYDELQREYERALASFHKLTYFDDLSEVARHPVPGGLFGSVVVPPPPQGITNTAAFESIYLLDEKAGVLYRMPRTGGALEPMLRPEDTIGQFVVGHVKAQAWREDNIIAVSQTGETGPFIFYYRNGDQWGYNLLAGSETWGRAGQHFRAVNYGGNLYVWDAGTPPNQIQKYLSGSYGQFPDPWIKNDGGQKTENAVDLAIDGNVYLLKPDGHILVFEAGAFKREIVPQGVNPPLGAVTRFFVTGDPESGSIFLLDLTQRVVQIDKQSGALIQQIHARPDSPLHLDQLTNLYVDSSGARPVLYLVNGGQILRGSVPDLPRPFRPAPSAAPSATAPAAATSAPADASSAATSPP